MRCGPILNCEEMVVKKELACNAISISDCACTLRLADPFGNFVKKKIKFLLELTKFLLFS